ncbi:MAG: 5'-methylthioadenosine/S-adenosylhomocysteine nucleosidase [Proteobacteria bacterium]|nr:5'-methylthioadenosine/S-adenosylhomocysteine nucleosidase [Pseudomonadota bacterium]
MRIVLYYAMPGEIASLIEQGAKLLSEFAGIKVYHIADQPHEVIAVAGGVGKVNAAMAVQFIILKYDPDLIIDVGVAGCFENVEIGTLLIARAFVQHDVDTTAVGDPIGLVSTVNCVEFPVEAFDIVCQTLDRLGIAYMPGLGATGDWFATGTERAKWISSTFKPLFCDMEGGAIAQVCYRNQVKMMAIKSVSDCLFGDGNYQFNFPKAMENLNQIVMQMIQNMEHIL